MRHELIILVDNIHQTTDARHGGAPSNEPDVLPLISAGVTWEDITGKPNPNTGVKVTQVKITCPDDATREAYEALDGTRYAIISAKEIPDAAI